MATQRSMPFASTTPSASVERNRAGTVRRFLASSVWSKVPRKAKAHAGWPAVETSRVAEWEEPRHPTRGAR